MDLNDLYFRQQVSRFGADNAACAGSRRTHRDMADAYGALIATARNSRRADEAKSGDAAARKRVRLALANQSAHWLPPRLMARLGKA